MDQLSRCDVSIILLTKNGQRYLKEVLQGIFEQQTRYTYEAIAIDSGSTDGTLEILREYPVRVVTIEPQQFNHGETRNLGARLSNPSVNYLVYLTQDATPVSGWLDSLVAVLEKDSTVAGAFSKHIPRPDCNPALARQMTEEWEQSGTPNRVVKRIEDLEDYLRHRSRYIYFSNTSSCIRRSVWERIPFSKIDFAEDAEWANRALLAGYTLVYEPKSAVLHSHNYPLLYQLMQNFDHAKGMSEILRGAGSALGLPQIKALVWTLARDFAYIRRQGIPGLQKAFWILYSPLWHLATLSGTILGRNHHRLPERLVRGLSYQARMRER